MNFIRELGQYLLFSSHNHDVVTVLETINGILPIHFEHNFDEKGEIQFSYKKKEGHRMSEAIAVAEKLGLPKEICEMAKEIKKEVVE